MEHDIERCDVTVVGGGLVGLATALSLARDRRAGVVVLEAENRVAAHQSGHNSGVIHSGLYYKPGSLKASNCVDGRERMFRFCAEHGVPHERCGKLVVATEERELPLLDELHRRGQANGLQGLRLLDPAGMREVEPHVAGLRALRVPQTGIVDFAAVAAQYARLLEQAGGRLLTNARLLQARRADGGWDLETARGGLRCRGLVNCAGLHSDRVARLCGVRPSVQILPFRGEYYELVPNRRHLVRNLVYPVPDPRFPFLGVHYTRTIHGGVEAGPNAVLALSRHGYRLRDVSVRDVLGMAAFRGSWAMALRYGRMGVWELHRSMSKAAFVRSLQRLIPEVGPEDVVPGGSGVRAQAVQPDGRLADDFRILRDERAVHVLNAPSPAATASLSIGDTVAAMAAEAFGLGAR